MNKKIEAKEDLEKENNKKNKDVKKNSDDIIPESIPVPEIPMSLKKEMFIEDLVKLCNNSDLPFFVIDMIMDNFIKDLKKITREQFETEKKHYINKVQEYNKFMESTKKAGE